MYRTVPVDSFNASGLTNRQANYHTQLNDMKNNLDVSHDNTGNVPHPHAHDEVRTTLGQSDSTDSSDARQAAPSIDPAPWVRERRYLRLYESTPAMLHSIDSCGRLVHVSDVWLATLGYTRDEVIGRQWVSFLTPASRVYAADIVIPDLFRNGHCEAIEYQVVRKSGSVIDVLLSAVVQHDACGTPLFSLTVMEDVTERKRVQSKLAEQYERLRVTLHSIRDAVITTDALGRIEYINPTAEQLTGWTTEDACGEASEKVFHVVDAISRRSVESPVEACLFHDRSIGEAVHTVLIGRDGGEYHIEDSAAPIKDATGTTLGVVLVFRDVSEQYRISREMTYRATHDTLTGLLNRDEFEHRLEYALESSLNTDADHALMFIDLDRFKLVNDAAGHAAGDRLLKQISELIQKVIRKRDTFARLGGDEFGLILEHCSIDVAFGIAQKICQRVDAFRFPHGAQHFHVGASIGLVPVDRRWTNTANILQAADSACHAAKVEGRNRVHTFFSDDQKIVAHRRDMHWVRRIERALDEGQFVLHWQQIRSLHKDEDRIHGEVLIRMLDDNGTLISPAAFLSSAERFHMISQIDRWVIRQVFEWMARHRDALSRVGSIGINLSGQSIGDQAFHRYVLDLIDELTFDHDKLCFEITETAAITNLVEATAFFDSMRERKIRFALDDFGSGVSSFGYLKTLPVDYLKIDGQFIRNLASDPVDQATVRCIHEIANTTGKRTVAEFVETESVERLLREIGIDYVQGYLRHRPAPLDEMLALATSG
ncbi:EAL domain-containing protein [Burkholderia ubonensis]|uniref:EAL domain-containing protein n=1 Tax=Burkholderia ubonensis TaxID=101571 RepID=UPI0012BA59FA|nr:EAL domain-containing protein [Burkholderia ubonensis]